MEILAIVFIIVMGVLLEATIYEKIIYPSLYYDCKFSVSEAIEGEQIEIIETVVNPRNLIVPSLKSEITTSKFLEFAANASTVNDKTRNLASLFTIGTRQKVSRSWKVNCLKRGQYTIGDTTIVANDLFGYRQYSTIFKVNSELIVLPKPIYLDILLSNYRNIQGDQVVKRFILEDPFITNGVREYTPHDSMNKIHWNSTAKMGQLMVRNNEATSKQSLTVILNMQLTKNQPKENIDDPKLETCIRLAAGELERTIPTSTPVKLLANAPISGHSNCYISQEMWGQAHIHELFVALACLQNQYCLNLPTFLRTTSELLNTSTILLITCFLDEECIKLIREKEQGGIHFKIFLYAYEEDCISYPDLEIYYLLSILSQKEVS